MEKLPSDRFYQTTLYKVFKLMDKEYKTMYKRYSYESHSKLYDVDVRESDKSKTYHVNCGFDTEPTKWHREIENHFKI